MYGYIYKTTNLINGKMYIGKHAAQVFEPDKYIGSGAVLRKAINKYGFNNFVCELIEWCETAEQLNEREKYWIQTFNSALSENYYNISYGGDGGLGRSLTNKNSYWSDPEKRAIAIEKQKISLKNFYEEHPDALAGENNPMFGKKQTDEAREKISTALKNSDGVKNSTRFSGHNHSEESKQKISNWSKQKIWINNGINETYTLDINDIPAGYSLGRLKNKDTEARLLKFENKNIDNNTGKKKKVLCIELNIIFESAAQACRELNIKLCSKISECCHGKRNTAGGYHWRFVEEDE